MNRSCQCIYSTRQINHLINRIILSFRNYRQCKFCPYFYFYTGAYITHLRDKHGEKIKCVDTVLLPDKGFLFENNYFLLLNNSWLAVLPTDSDDDSNEESSKKNEPSNEENDLVGDENELWNEENDLLDEKDVFADSENGRVQSIAVLQVEDPSAMILNVRFEMLSDHESGNVQNEEADRFDEQFDQPDDWTPFENEEVYRFAEWIVKHRISQTAVDELLKSPVFQGNYTFTSTYAVFKRIDKITYELCMQTWKSGKVSVDHA